MWLKKGPKNLALKKLGKKKICPKKRSDLKENTWLTF